MRYYEVSAVWSNDGTEFWSGIEAADMPYLLRWLAQQIEQNHRQVIGLIIRDDEMLLPVEARR